jgi:hypothetical protein
VMAAGQIEIGGMVKSVQASTQTDITAISE